MTKLIDRAALEQFVKDWLWVNDMRLTNEHALPDLVSVLIPAINEHTEAVIRDEAGKDMGDDYIAYRMKELVIK